MFGLSPAELTGLGLVMFGGWSLVMYFVRLVLTGKLVPRNSIEDLAHDRDEWRAAHRISETARQEERDHNADLTHDIAEPLRGFLRGFRQAAGTGNDEVGQR